MPIARPRCTARCIERTGFPLVSDVADVNAKLALALTLLAIAAFAAWAPDAFAGPFISSHNSFRRAMCAASWAGDSSASCPVLERNRNKILDRVSPARHPLRITTRSEHMTEPQLAPDGEPVSNADVDQAIAACGSARAAVRELLITKGLLEHELAMAHAVIPYGFSRGWHHRRRADGTA
jgi:hypothetical protein